MEDIRDKFLNECQKIREQSIGYMFVTDNFTDEAGNQQEEIISAIKKPNEAWKEQIALWRSSLQGFRENRDMPLELFHAYFVQAWYGFLDNLFERMLEEHFAGLKTYNIKAIQIEFISLEDTPHSLANNIKRRAWEYFSNKLKPEEKLSTIMKALDATVPEQVKSNIRKHVAVRNVFQHNRGTLRERDLKLFQSDHFKYPCGEAEYFGDTSDPNQPADYHLKTYRVGDTIRIDNVVLNQIYDDLVEAAKNLVS